MKIALITDKMGIGGAESHIYTLAVELKGMGHVPVVVSSGGTLAEKLKKEGIRQVRLPLTSKNPFTVAVERSMLRELLKREKFDIVHAHARLSSFVVSGVCRELGIPLVTTAHAMFKMSPVKSCLSRFGESTICVSEDINDLLEGRAQRLCVIENGVPEYTAEREKHGQSILFVSRMDSDCSLGALLLCRAAPKLLRDFPSLKITLVGGGNDFERVRGEAERANALCGKKVVFAAGASASPWKYYKNTDLFAGVSRACLEAMGAGLPCVLLGNEGYLGLLDSESLSVAQKSNFCGRGEKSASEDLLRGDIRKFFSLSSCEREVLGKDMRDFVRRHYSAEGMALKTLSVYKSVIDERKQAPENVLACGYYGFHNLGDDAILKSIISRLGEISPKTNITVMTKNGKADRSLYGVRCIDRLDLGAVIGAMRECDIFLFGGGSLLQDKTSRRSLAYYLFIIFLSGILCRKSVMLANGIGPFSCETSELLSICMLGSFDKISVRDGLSLEYLKGRTGQSVSLLPDMVFMNDYDAKQIQKDKSFAVCLSLDHEKYLPLILSLTERIHSELGLYPVLVLLDPKRDSRALPYLISTLEACGGKIAYAENEKDCIELFSRAELVLSMRLHGLIFSAVSGTLPIALGDDTKLSGFCRDFALPEPFSHGESAENVFSCIRELLGRREKVQKNISEKVAELKRKTKEGFSEIISDFK